MAKTEFLQIRLTPGDRARVERAAAADHLEPSTWARRLILQAVDDAESAAPASRRTPQKDSTR